MTASLPSNDLVLELFKKDPGTPIPIQDIAGYRAFASSASDEQIIELVEVIRRWWATIAVFPQYSASETDALRRADRPTFSAMGDYQDTGSPTKVTLPGTAAEILELVRRAPEIFNKFSPAERLEAIRVTTSKRYQERLELVQEATSSSVEVDENMEEESQVTKVMDAEDRVQSWFQERPEESASQRTATQVVAVTRDDTNTGEVHESET